MYDFNNPYNSDIQKFLFPDIESVDSFIAKLDDSILQLSILPDTDPNYSAIIHRNIEYIRLGLSYSAVSESGRDLTRFKEVIAPGYKVIPPPRPVNPHIVDATIYEL